MHTPRIRAGVTDIPESRIMDLEVAGVLRLVCEDGSCGDAAFVLYLEGIFPDGKRVAGHTRLTLEQVCGLIAQLNVELDDANISQQRREELSAKVAEELRATPPPWTKRR